MIFTKRRPAGGTLRCTLCGREIARGEEYWTCNGDRSCAECLLELARRELAPLPGNPGKGGEAMTLLEMSLSYRDSASAIHGRIVELRDRERVQQDPDELFRLRRRIDELMPLWREARDLATLTEHYYDRSYHKHERYTI